VTAIELQGRHPQRESVPGTRPPSGWWSRRGRAATLERQRAALRRAHKALALLELTRETLERGWVQDRWYETRTDRGTGSANLLATETIGPGDVAGACIVGALELAVRQRSARADLTVDGGPAIDFVWDALQETRGLPGPGVAGRAAPRDVRVARLRDLVHWNDRSGRTQDEALRLLDLAISRAILTEMRQPVAAGLTGERHAP
jgi:hypothetical protein